MPNVNRVGISALSKSRIADAYNEEIMIDKLTGEFLVKTQSGDTVSYNYNLRVKSAFDYLLKESSDKSVYGDIYQLELPSVQFPVNLASNTNLLSSTETITNNFNKFMINVDVSSLSINPLGISSKTRDIQIVLEFTVGYSDMTTSETISITDYQSVINNKIFDLKDVTEFPEIDQTKTINFLNFTVIKVLNNVYDYPTDTMIEDIDLRHILHSVHVLVAV